MGGVKFWIGFCYLFLAALFLYLCFSHPPFIQQEIIGQAFWWAYLKNPFLESLFNPYAMDSHLGRFRYWEYLLEAGYWKSMRNGWLPKDLYDYFAILATVQISSLIYAICCRRKLSNLATFLLVAVFVLGAPSFMVVTWNYRKAKYLASCLLVVLAFLLEKTRGNRSRFFLPVMNCTVLGVFTDPFFTLLSLCLGLGYDLCEREKRWGRTLSVGAGLFLGACFVVVLNGIVGPLFNEMCKLLTTSIPDKPEVYLSVSNFSFIFEMLPDLFFPGLWVDFEAFSILGIFFLGWYALFLWGAFRGRARQSPLIFAFLMCLPAGAFLVRPVGNVGMYAGYYGHPTFLLFVLSFVDIATYFRTEGRKTYRSLVYLLLIVIIVCHQEGKDSVFRVWTEHHVEHAGTKRKFDNDYRELQNIRAYLKKNSKEPYHLSLDTETLKEFYFRRKYEMDQPDLKTRHTTLAYVMIPVMFHQEIEQNRLVLFHEQKDDKPQG